MVVLCLLPCHLSFYQINMYSTCYNIYQNLILLMLCSAIPTVLIFTEYYLKMQKALALAFLLKLNIPGIW